MVPKPFHRVDLAVEHVLRANKWQTHELYLNVVNHFKETFIGGWTFSDYRQLYLTDEMEVLTLKLVKSDWIERIQMNSIERLHYAMLWRSSSVRSKEIYGNG
jgi:hypothetical protein